MILITGRRACRQAAASATTACIPAKERVAAQLAHLLDVAHAQGSGRSARQHLILVIKEAAALPIVLVCGGAGRVGWCRE